jgi:hypothetical protein
MDLVEDTQRPVADFLRTRKRNGRTGGSRPDQAHQLRFADAINHERVRERAMNRPRCQIAFDTNRLEQSANDSPSERIILDDENSGDVPVNITYHQISISKPLQ